MGPLMKTPRHSAAGRANAIAMTRGTGERAWSVCGLLMALSMVALVLTGCTTTGGAGGAFCDVAKPIRPTEASLAAMSDDEVEEALAHNEYGQRACGWKH